jgi:ATP-binding cassette subfamily B (MDR/TAP) protein 1
VIISGASDGITAALTAKLRGRFEIGEEGPLEYFLGMSVTDTPGADLSLSQLHYVEEIITRFGYDELSEVDTPMVEGLSLHRNSDDILYENFNIICKIGNLMFAIVCTRPDICYAASYLTRFINHLFKEVCIAVL